MTLLVQHATSGHKTTHAITGQEGVLPEFTELFRLINKELESAAIGVENLTATVDEPRTSFGGANGVAQPDECGSRIGTGNTLVLSA